jgi:hypothetical protein
MDCFEKYNILVEDWLPDSPDLNSVEYVWVELKRGLHRKYPDIGNTKGGVENVQARLAEIQPEIWNEILEVYF